MLRQKPSITPTPTYTATGKPPDPFLHLTSNCKSIGLDEYQTYQVSNLLVHWAT
jgi:hypothetical protein